MQCVKNLKERCTNEKNPACAVRSADPGSFNRRLRRQRNQIRRRQSRIESRRNAGAPCRTAELPHAELLNFVKPQLAKEGVDLQIIEFSDYVKPNLSLNDKEIDANFFQHIPYLEEFAKERNMPLVTLTKVHIEPMGVYSAKFKSLDEMPAGAKIAIPNDPTNGGRALMLLQSAGLLKLKDGVTITATPGDIVDNPKNIEIVEIEAALLPRSMNDVDYSVINSNFAMEAKLNPVKDSLFTEPKESPYANVVAIRKGDENRPELQKLAKALTSPEVKKFIEETYKGAVVPAF